MNAVQSSGVQSEHSDLEWSVLSLASILVRVCLISVLHMFYDTHRCMWLVISHRGEKREVFWFTWAATCSRRASHDRFPIISIKLPIGTSQSMLAPY